MVDRAYTDRSLLLEVKWNTAVVQTRTYDANGRLRKTTSGNGLVRDHFYRADNLPASIYSPQVTGATGRVQGYTYDYDANKNRTGEGMHFALGAYSSPTGTVFDDEDKRRTQGKMIFLGWTRLAYCR